MASIQCKMCGYMVELSEGVTVCECPACGSMTTFPKCASEHTEQLHARAEHFRQRNEFDKAMDAYEAIVRETPDDAEAYWGMVLSRFGIEYVEDPLSHERVPTCHRVQYESILADSDYKSALEHADASQQAVYETEAKRIAEIQKGILAISAQEKPFDVFICYKETTEGGSRTKDSAIAQDIYYQLTNAGYKVFFSRITLEDKLGQQYEPYIFAALNSAKVMLVVGSKKEYFNAVWVKNEWSRYLALMKRDRSRLLIPCYRDMDAYDLPDELSMLQSQDMSKIGFIQDLLRGIKKVLGGDKPAGTVAPSQPQGDSGVVPLMKRIAIFLETEDFAQAREYCNKVLDKDPENGEAYLLQLLAENQLKSEEELYTLQDDLDSLPTFKLTMKFADAPLKARLQEQVKKQQDERLYKKLIKHVQYNAINSLEPKEQIRIYQSMAADFASLDGYKESEELRRQCEQQAEAVRVQQYDAYNQAVEHCVSLTKRSTTPEAWKAEAERFRALSDVVPEAAEMASQCEENVIVSRYNKALKLKNAKNYPEAIQVFTALKGYGDSEQQLLECRYNQALELKNTKNYSEAIQVFIGLKGYGDSSQQIALCQREIAVEKKRRLLKTFYVGCVVIFVCIVAYVIITTIVDKQREIHRLESEAQVAYEQGEWQKMETLGDKLGKLSSKEGQAVIARSKELHTKQLMDAAETAYQQGDWQRMESLGKELAELSSKEGQAVIACSLELHRIADEKVKAGGQGLYMVVDLQTWKVRYSTAGPDISKNTFRTTELWLRRINPGTFTMGSPVGELGWFSGETRHQVTLTQIYYIGVFECTQKQWELVMGSNPSVFKGDGRPVENVSYDMLRGEDNGSKWPSGSEVDNDSFFGRLRARTGLAFDLPTEAQWEYACRAGTSTALNSGKNITSSSGSCQNLDTVGWYKENSGDTTHPVGQKQPNAWGLYDMHGNVSEWCLDWYGAYPNEAVEKPLGSQSGEYRVFRGGSWYSYAQICRSAYRCYFKPSGRGYYIGFRVALRP